MSKRWAGGALLVVVVVGLLLAHYLGGNLGTDVDVVPQATAAGAAAKEAQDGGATAAVRDTAWNADYSEGMELYEQNCAACHGAEGRGKIGLPLNLQSFLTLARKDYLLRTMEHGRPSRGMPAFKETLSEAQRRAIATYIKGWQTEPNKDYRNVDRIQGDPRRGEAWFKGVCAGCHGANGQGGPRVGGGHIAGATKGFAAPALGDPGFLSSATDGYIKATLMYGRPGTPMGSYLKGKQGFVEFSEKQLDDIVAYIRSFENR